MGPRQNSDEAAMAMEVALWGGQSQVGRGSVAGEMKLCEGQRGGKGRGRPGLPAGPTGPLSFPCRPWRWGGLGQETEAAEKWKLAAFGMKLSFMNARNVQRSIWFCFFQLPPLSTAWVLWRGPQPSLDVPSAKRLCHHGDSSVRVCVCVVAGRRGRPPLSSQTKPYGARSPRDPGGSGSMM